MQKADNLYSLSLYSLLHFYMYFTAIIQFHFYYNKKVHFNFILILSRIFNLVFRVNEDEYFMNTVL